MYADKAKTIILIDQQTAAERAAADALIAQLTPDMRQALRSSLRLNDVIPSATLATSRTALVKLGLARKSSKGTHLVNTSTGRSVARRLIRLASNA